MRRSLRPRQVAEVGSGTVKYIELVPPDLSLPPAGHPAARLLRSPAMLSAPWLPGSPLPLTAHVCALCAAGTRLARRSRGRLAGGWAALERAALCSQKFRRLRRAKGSCGW